MKGVLRSDGVQVARLRGAVTARDRPKRTHQSKGTVLGYSRCSASCRRGAALSGPMACAATPSSVRLRGEPVTLCTVRLFDGRLSLGRR